MSGFRTMKVDILKRCGADHVGLWLVLRWVQDPHMNVPREKERIVVLRVLRDLLESGLVLAGFPDSDGRGFVPWTLTPEEAIARIDREWVELGRDPNVGQIVWFTTSAQGDRFMSDE